MIALAIVGIIAALTIPVLYADYQRSLQEIAIKKNYNEFGNLVALAMTDHPASSFPQSRIAHTDQVTDVLPDGTTSTFSNGAEWFLKTYFSVTFDCGTDATSCFADSYKNVNGDAGDFTCDGYAVKIKDGAAICMIAPQNIPLRPFNPKGGLVGNGGIIVNPGIPIGGGGSIDIGGGDLSPPDDSNGVFIDINGAAPPNIGGRDMFYFQILDDGSLTQTAADINTCKDSPFGDGCLGMLIQDDWKMNY